MLNGLVLHFAPCVLRSLADLDAAMHEIYRHWRAGNRIIAIVSGLNFTGDTAPCFAPRGEYTMAVRIVRRLRDYGVPSRCTELRALADDRLLGGPPGPIAAAELRECWKGCPILIVPRRRASTTAGPRTRNSRYASELAAISIAAELRAGCRLLKRIPRTYVNLKSPDFGRRANGSVAMRKPKLRNVPLAIVPVAIGRPNERATLIGTQEHHCTSLSARGRAIRIALIGCGAVGRSMYEALQGQRSSLELVHVVVRRETRYQHIERVTQELSRAFEPDIDVVVVCIGGMRQAQLITRRALDLGKHVVTPNKAVAMGLECLLGAVSRGPCRRLWHSATVGAAMPVLEILAAIKVPVREVRGVLNASPGEAPKPRATSLDQRTTDEAGQSRAVCDPHPIRSLTGRDSAEQLSLLVQVAFNTWIAPETIPTTGIGHVVGRRKTVRLVARATRTPEGVVASVRPARVSLRNACDNRIEIELQDGRIVHLRGTGDGPRAATLSMMGDLYEIARRLTRTGAPADVKEAFSQPSANDLIPTAGSQGMPRNRSDQLA